MLAGVWKSKETGRKKVNENVIFKFRCRRCFGTCDWTV